MQGHALEPQRLHHHHHHHNGPSGSNSNDAAGQEEAAASSTGTSATKSASAQSLDTSTATISISAPSQSASIASDSSRNTTARGSTGRGGGGGGGGDDGRAGSGSQQMTIIRRHLTAGKKRERVKRLTEMAKCEAVDMTDPQVSGHHHHHHGDGDDSDSHAHFMPPMIILSQQRQDIRYPEDSLPVAGGTAVGASVRLTAGLQPGNVRAGAGVDVNTSGGSSSNSPAARPGGIYRTKSLSSLVATHSYGSPTRGKALSQHDAQSGYAAGLLDNPHSGSLPDLATEEEEDQERALGSSKASAERERGGAGQGKAAGGSESLFTDGIVGKNIQKEAEGRKGGLLLESRPFLPATPGYRSRSRPGVGGGRPSGRRSSLGLRDRGPVTVAADAPASTTATSTSVTTATTATTVLALDPGGQALNRSKILGSIPPDGHPLGSLSSEHSSSLCQTLPTLTITGLHRDRPPPGAAASNSRAARELRPASRSGVVSSSMQLFQQLDDQCEKLQRQLNISLNVPRRGSQWQVGFLGG